VLNFAHGLFLSVGAYATWWAAGAFPGAGSRGWGFALAVLVGVVAGAAVAALVELVLIRPLYRRPIQQVLVTVGLSLAGVALLQAVWGADARPFPRPAWTQDVTHIDGAAVPNSGLLLIGVATAVLLALVALLRFTRIGLVIRAGVEDRAMVTALGIDVRRAFTLVFAIGGAAAALAGILAGISFGSVSPGQGTSLLIFGFIVVVIGGMGSITGSAAAAVAVGLVQQFINYYEPGLGDVCVVGLLALVLLVRPQGLAGVAGRAAA
jgi:branched-chain amino acid transport system permease protein